ncbi:hypothetical protein V8E36_003456 [Tilletia maclaganii]
MHSARLMPSGVSKSRMTEGVRGHSKGARFCSVSVADRMSLLLLLVVFILCTGVNSISSSSALSAKPVPGFPSLLAYKSTEAELLRGHIDGVGPDDPLVRAFRFDQADEDERAAAQGLYGPHTFTQPLDHFHNTTRATFNQRFWISTQHYNPRSKLPTPVYVVDGGETSGINRLPFLSQGILDILSEATGGIGIILEHRYYGTSKPKLADIGNKTYWDVDALRWLTNEQALEDSARFMRQFKMPGKNSPLAHLNLTAANTPWIYIGGSYAGARAAHMRVLYPDIVFGAISTSGVTAAIENFPQYYYPIARGSDPACSQAIQAAIGAFDAIAVPAASNTSTSHIPSDTATLSKREAALRKLFDADDLDLDDLGNVLSLPLGFFQTLNWDPAVSNSGWDQFCEVMTNRTAIKDHAPRALLAAGEKMSSTISARRESMSRLRLTRPDNIAAKIEEIQAGFQRSSIPALRAELSSSGHLPPLPSGAGQESLPAETAWLPDELFRLASYIRAHFIEPCHRSGSTLRQCFSTKGSESWEDFVKAPRLSSSKAWMWQVCTQWGYFQGAPPPPPSIANVPSSHKRIHPHGPLSQSSTTALDLAEIQHIMMSALKAMDASAPDVAAAAAAADAKRILYERAGATAFNSGPQLVSSLLDLSYTAAYCPEAFPPTASVRVPDRPDIDEVNKLGGFAIGQGSGGPDGAGGLDRLAIVNGQWDPWRPATPHSEEFAGGGRRADTLMRPFKLIPNCWHHCDQNGLPTAERKAGKEPERIRKIHAEEIAFVWAWLLRWGKDK